MAEVNDIRIDKSATKISVVSPFSWEFLDKVQLLGGEWNPRSRRWVLPIDAEKALRKALISVYGKDDQPTELVNVHVTVHEDIEAVRRGIEWWGRVIAQARDRDSGALPGQGVAFSKGKPRSGGSRALWKTHIYKDSELEIYDVPLRAVFGRQYPGIEVTVFDKRGERIDRVS